MHAKSLLAALALAAYPAPALNISGFVLDKIGTPLPLAKVCLQTDASKCVTTGISGDFHISDGIGVRKLSPRGDDYAMAYRNGTLTLEAPAATSARLEWIAPEGRRLLASSDLELAAGRNVLALPAGLRNGVCFLRLITGDLTVAWKASLVEGRASARRQSAPRIIALAKTAAVTALVITKTGYRAETYRPAKETETKVVVVLTQTDDVGFPYDGKYIAKVIAIDRTKKTMITESVEGYCDSTDALQHDTLRDTSSYAIRDGKMWVWYTGDCSGQVFSGTAADPVGTWNMVDPVEPLPDDLRAGCKPSAADSDEVDLGTYKAVYKISETAIQGDFTVEICPADAFGPDVASLFDNDTTIEVVKNTCKQATFRNGKGETADLNFTKIGDSLHIAFVYKGKSCDGQLDMGLGGGDPKCPDTSDGLLPFAICTSTSGFAKTTGLVKKTTATSPLPISREILAPTWKPLPTSPDFRAPRAAALPVGSIFSGHGWHPARK